MSNTKKLSVILVSFNMERELPRTLLSLTPWFQKVDSGNYEVLVIQNGGHLLDSSQIESVAPNYRAIYPSVVRPSPCAAINEAVREHASGEYLLIIIDGARIASPGLLRTIFEASDTFDLSSSCFYAPAYHLGWALQKNSAKNGYNQAVEDSMLDNLDWSCGDGYDLFKASAQAASMQCCFA